MTPLFIAIALAAPMAPAAAVPVAVVRPVNQLDQLVLLLVPDQAMLETVTAMARRQLLLSPEFKRDPAMADFVAARLKPEMGKVMRDELPELRTEIAGIVTKSLTPDEISDVYTFFASPTGQKLQRHAFRALAENPDATPEQLQRIAAESFSADVKLSDTPALSTFAASAGGRKMHQVTPLVGAASNAWGERMIARHSARFTTLRTQAIADYQRNRGTSQ